MTLYTYFGLYVKAE